MHLVIWSPAGELTKEVMELLESRASLEGMDHQGRLEAVEHSPILFTWLPGYVTRKPPAPATMLSLPTAMSSSP